MMLQFSDRRRRPMMSSNIIYSSVPPQRKTQVSEIPPAPEVKKEVNRWGQPTWFMLHTLAEKVKHDSFPAIRKELLNMIYTICNNLPCPICRSHALDYLNSVNYNTIMTKDQLKRILFDFHNSVNLRKNYPLFPMEEVNAKYSTAITDKIIQNFMFFSGQ